MHSFDSFGLPAPLVAELASRGMRTAFPVQAQSLPDALAGRDLLGKAQTGSGKTLAFGIPLIVRAVRAKRHRPTALVLAPTRELAAQIGEELEPLADAIGCRLGVVYGGTPIEPQINRLRGGVDVLIATPGRLIDIVERGAVELVDVDAVAIDEADRMADLGFLPQVQWLLRLVPPGGQTMLFSATLDGAVASLAGRMTDPTLVDIVAAEPTVESMTHRFLHVHWRDKTKLVARLSESTERVLVFCRTKRACDRVVEELVELDVGAVALHGDLPQSHRRQSLAQFAAGTKPVLVATDVAARGIHVDDIEMVIHFDPPEDHKAYLHRSGRTARAGASGLVVSLVEWDQELETRRLQRRLRLHHVPIVEMFSNDDRLADLASWDPAEHVA